LDPADDRSFAGTPSVTGFEGSKHGGVMGRTRLLCDLVTQALPVDGAAILTSGKADVSALLYATDPVIAQLDDLEFVTGEGPCLEAYRTDAPVQEPDLAGTSATARWPWFAPEAAASGVRAVFAFPLQAGAVRFGVFWLYRRAPGGLTDRHLNTVLQVAHTAAAVVLTDVAEHSGAQLDAHIRDLPFGRVEIDRALGVIAGQRHSDIDEARVLLRSVAYAQNRSSLSVAQDVLTHRLTFPPDPG
jgi:GAF domain-containing protein